MPSPPGQNLAPGRSSNFLHDHIQVGDILQLRAPAGHFHLDHGDSPIVLIAGGIGITPMFSMLDWCLAEQPGREVWLFYGIRNSRELVMPAHLQAQAAAHPQFKLRLSGTVPVVGIVAGRCFSGNAALLGCRDMIIATRNSNIGMGGPTQHCCATCCQPIAPRPTGCKTSCACSSTATLCSNCAPVSASASSPRWHASKAGPSA